MERGLYNDTSLFVNSDCFGDQFVRKINEFMHIVEVKPFGNFFSNVLPGISILYQVYFMLTSKCGMHVAVNDFMLYCWYKGCQPEQFWEYIKRNFLYVLRNFNDAAIVWWEGIPEGYDKPEEIEKWVTLTETTGRTSSQSFIDLTGFRPVPLSEQV